MFYITIFLSMLVGLLIYIMDPVPTDLRNELTSRDADADVMLFLNQHQAAKDYLKYWLVRIAPGQTDKNEISLWTDPTFTFSADTLPNQEASVISLYPDFSRFFGNFADDIYESATSATALKKQAMWSGASGTFVSALLCTQSDLSEPQFCYNVDPTTKRITPTGAITYAITYGIDRNVQDDWGPFWPQALRRRSHSTANCGILRYREDGYCYDITQSSLYQRVINKEVGHCSTGLAAGYSYCLDNGGGCVNVLPNVIITYLKAALSNDDTPLDNVDGALLCFSKVENPYEETGLKIHYDGIDNKAIGAGSLLGGSLWPIKGAEISNFTSISLKDIQALNLVIDPSTPEIIKSSGTYPNISQANNCISTCKTPYNSCQSACISTCIDPDTEECQLCKDACVSDYNTCSSSCGPSLYTFAIDASNDVTILGSAAPQSFTLIKKNGQLYFYYNGCQVNLPAGTWPTEISIPSWDSAAIKDLRLYTSPLSPSQVEKNLKVDTFRYGVPKAKCEDNLIPITN